MGATRLRDDEFKFITKTRESKEIRDILKGDRGAQAKAATRIEELYRAEFSHALGGETEAEYAERKKVEPKAKRLTAESEEERQSRLDRIHGLIVGILKRKSDKFSRNRKASQSKARVHSESDDDSPPQLVSTSNAYREFQQSQHPLKPHMPSGNETPRSEAMRDYNRGMKIAYDNLSPAERQRYQAQAAEKRVKYRSIEQSEARRGKVADDMPNTVDTTLKAWQKTSGFVGWSPVGGLNSAGELVYEGPTTGRDHRGMDLPHRLAHELGTSKAYLDSLIHRWLADTFDGPTMANQECLPQSSTSLPATALTQSLARSQSTLVRPDLPLPDSSELPGKDSGSLAPTTTTHPTVHAAPSPRSPRTDRACCAASAQPESHVADPADPPAPPASRVAVQTPPTAARHRRFASLASSSDEQASSHDSESDGTVHAADLIAAVEKITKTRPTLVPKLTIAASTVIPEPTTHDVSRIPTKGRAPPKRQRAAASGKTKAVATPRNTKLGASSSTAVGEVPVPLAASDDHPTEDDRNPEIAKSRAGRVIRKTARGQGVSPDMSAAKKAGISTSANGPAGPRKRDAPDEDGPQERSTSKKRR
ncbi:hypothetical protein C8Q76DRAFT_791484 [Earliella scabrosa]|nr:hypothetical protein C8Q76DRAFT_791484 [Earliella scabrosa]